MTRPALPPNAALRWAVVHRIVEDLRPATVLEIGCGQGAFGARLASGRRYLGVEPDATSYAVARSRIGPAGGDVRNVAVGDLPGDQTYDLICAFEVLEHLADDAAAVRTWRRFVRPGGHLLLSTPAWPERFNAWDELVGHYRRYTPSHLTAVLTAAGFADVDVTVYGWPLGYALEAVRGRVAHRRGVASEDGEAAARAPEAMDARTARSGRLLQPTALTGAVLQAATTPFAWLQARQPTRGTGLVAVACSP